MNIKSDKKFEKKNRKIREKKQCDKKATDKFK